MRLRIPLLAFTLLAIFAGGVFAVRMSPAAFTAQNIPVGSEFDVGVPLTIRLSDGDTTAKYFTVMSLKPSDVRKEWLAGYEEIPSSEFLKVGGEVPVIVEPGNPSVRRILVDFPEDSAFMNRHFLAQLRVQPQESAGMFQAVLVGSYLLETAPSKDRFVRPEGSPISVAPSVVVLDSSGVGIVRVYNNHNHAVEVSARLEIPPRTDRMQIELTRGFLRGIIDDRISLDKKALLVQPGGFEDIVVRMDSELRNGISRNSEYILWVEVPAMTTSARFVRVHYRP